MPSLYHKVIDDLYEQVVDHDRPRGSQFDYCEDITEQYIDKMSDIELQYWYDTYINDKKDIAQWKKTTSAPTWFNLPDESERQVMNSTI